MIGGASSEEGADGMSYLFDVRCINHRGRLAGRIGTRLEVVGFFTEHNP